MRMTTGTGEEATRAAGGSYTETRTAWNTPLRIRRRRQRSETTSRRGGTTDRRSRRRGRTETTITNTGGVRMEGRRGRGRPCRCDAVGGDGDVGRRTGTVDGAAGGDVDEEEGEAGAVAAVFRRNSSDAVAWTGKRMALLCRKRQRRRKPTLRQSGTGGWRWYSGGNATVHQRGRVSDGPRAKRRAGRRRGDTCEAEEGGGDVSRCTGEAAQAAGGWPVPRKVEEEAVRGGAATGMAREGVKTRERSEGVPFYRQREGAGHGRSGERRRKSRPAAMEGGRGRTGRSRR
uniref:Uncharacterized protein n=2 Tax=Oryza sativa subsp. japonica TaxID=39947 RepID=Q53JU3_ORYSJ|nr:hypothetical protein LOC_Os11g23150 [Oryza sativa Japonica Group]ABA93103.1 hypothetical protein LOC_Os11g23150 [Oryza sativa Japonica Group]